jgi:hypothetical protein
MALSVPYAAAVEQVMKILYLTLRENDRRRYAAVEAAKFGHGGTEYISQLLGCDPKTIRQGQADLQDLEDLAPENLGPSQRVRKKGVVVGRS